MNARARLLTAIAALSIATPAIAIPVFDASNYAQNILTAARTLAMIDNQVRQLQNEAQSLLNQARHLTSLPTNVMSALEQRLARSQALLRDAQGLAFEVFSAEAAFRRTYPAQYDATIGRAGLAADARSRWTNSLEALRTATQVQAEVAASIDADMGTLDELVTASQGAVGSLQATQATNQLIALRAQQSMQTQRLLVAGERARALEAARGLVSNAQALETRRRFKGGDAAAYAPADVAMFR